jgi:HAD superfamily hydrolase (TIGR01458 family)
MQWRIKAVLLDLSGVLYIGDEVVPGAHEAITALRKAGIPLRLITNTTRSTRRQIAAKLTGLGFDFPETWIFTPPMAVRQYLRRQRLRPHLLVHLALLAEFDDIDTTTPNALVVGDAGEYFDYDSLNTAFRVLQQDTHFIAMGDNRYFREADGLSLDIGPFVKALEYASGKTATIIGKPARTFFLEAIDALGCAPGEVLMVGDDAQADVGGALRAGLQAVLVKTGKYRAGDEETIGADGWRLIDSIAQLPALPGL